MDTLFFTTTLTILVLVVEAVGGVALGWWLRGGLRPSSDDADARRDAQHARESLEKVRVLTETVAKNVGAHKTRVQAISDELSAKTDDSAEGDAGADILASISHLVEANEQMHEQLAQAEDRMKEQAVEIETHAEIARTDALTEIDNRRAFDDDLRQCVSNWSRLNTPFSLLILDVDHFKKFNDTHGHQAGDEVLKGVARTIVNSVRDVDLVSRYGGEEFAVIIPGSELLEAKAAADKVRAAIESSVFRYQTTDLRVTASLGVAQVLEDEGGDSLIMRADTALYLAKEHTRNCSFFHDGEQGHLFESIDEAEAPTEAVSEKEDVPEVETPQQLDLQTGLPNRKVFLKDTARRIAEWQRYKSPLSTISIVVDDYDRWIEERGEPARDVMLKIVTEFLQAAMRDMDVVARSGENLFAILLPGATMDHAVEVAERLRVAIARCTVQLAGSPLNVTISLGVAVATLDDEAESFLARSEAAAVGASETGGDAICVHDGEHCERIGVELEAIE